MNSLQADHKNKIYCGEEIFEVIIDKFNEASRTKGLVFLGSISFVKLSILEPNQLLTMDPVLKTIMEKLNNVNICGKMQTDGTGCN